ncbi:heme ABC transporter ATP-binding protein [Pandoraea terrae]|uniref:heme ABC transporter ATP-binding protein n=1 Tax=Pandoraea terrae TaxID=1537710 RepID=UPI003B836651
MSAHDLTIVHGAKRVLNGLSIDIRPGELLTLLGRNGAGKSTLMKALAGELASLRSIGHGSVTLNGVPLPAIKAAPLALLRAVLPQTAALAFPFTAREIVMMGRHPHQQARRRDASHEAVVMAALWRADAAAFADRDVTTLSGGEWARVQFARVLAQLWPDENRRAPSVPRYLLLDEPTAALDLAHQHRLLALTRQLAREWGIGVLAIVHDVNLAARHADAMALLVHGRILARGAPAEIMEASLIEAALGLPVRIIRPDTATGGAPYAVPI